MNERVELLFRILCDPPPAKPVDAAYLFAETEPNQASVFAVGRALVKHGTVARLLISDCTAKSGYLGAAAYRQAMIAAGIPDQAITEAPMEPTDILHTLIEAQAVVRYAKTKGDRQLLIVAVPFHQERAFITTVSVALREYPELKLYSWPGNALPWDETVTHSQGTLRGSRAELIAGEQRRIEEYTAKGDLAPRSEILRYLRTRDRNE